jgi:hypothetical protein
MPSHGRTGLMVLYTNEPQWVDRCIATFEWFLREDKYKVVGFDLEYTHEHVGHDQKVTVGQLCMRQHVLIYHYCG